jgi:peptidoglycan/LPS O-acetylase OafA/YrhL
VRQLFLTCWYQWALGAWLAEVYVSPVPPRWGAILFRFPGAVWVWTATSFLLAYLNQIEFTIFRVQVAHWSLPFISTLLLGAAVTRPRPAWRFLTRIGTWSYSLYLVHPCTFALLLPWIGGLAPALQAVLLAIGAVFCSWLMFTGIEQPSLRARSRSVALASTGAIQPSP